MGRDSKNLRVYILLMVSLEKLIGLSGSFCNKQSSHLLGLEGLGRVRRKNANEDSRISSSR